MRRPIYLDDKTLSSIQKLIEENFTGRDELYAAADTVRSRLRQHICRRLAEHLASNAIELQQIVAASGGRPAGPLDVHTMAHALFDLAKMNRGEPGVLRAAADGERMLKNDYDRTIETLSDHELKAVLHRQREEVEFGEEVLEGLEGSVPD